MDVPLTLVLPSYVIHSHYLLGSSPSSLPSSIVIAIVIVHPQFKRNTYLSLLRDWIIFFLQNYFSFLSSKSAVEACDVNNYCWHSAFSSYVQASHVMHFYMCVADSVSIFLLCVFLFYSVSYFPSQGPIFTAGKLFPAGEQGGGGGGLLLPLPPWGLGDNSQT